MIGKHYQLFGGKTMEINLERIQNTLIVKLAGEIDHHSAANIRTAVDNELTFSPIKNIVFDFGGVTFMDSSGIGMVIGRYKQAKARGGKILIVRAKPQVDKLLELSGIKKIIEINGEVGNLG